MKWFDEVLKVFRNASLENPSTALNGANLGFEGGITSAGMSVTELSSMRCTAVYRCVALRSGIIASLPLHVYKATEKGRELAVSHRMYPLLFSEPGGKSSFISAFNWKERIITDLMLWGNHYSVVEYDGAGRVVSLTPVNPAAVQVKREGSRNKYTFTLVGGDQETLDQSDVIHIAGLGFDGLKGISPISWVGKQSIGLALAIEEFVGSMHTNSTRPSGWIELPKNISPEGFAQLRAKMEGMNSGTRNAGRTLYLDNGSSWNQMQMSMVDAQTLENRKFQISDIARLFGVPEHLLGSMDKSTSWGSGIEQLTIGFKVMSLNPDMVRIEGELNRKLFQWPYYCEFDRAALDAMDSKAQAEMHASAIQNAIMTPNEVRRKRNLPDNDHPDANKLFIQGATVPLGTITGKHISSSDVGSANANGSQSNAVN